MADKKSIIGTQTEKNLVIAYLSESAAYSRYTYYAKQATKEEYFPVANVFEETAANELHHGKVFFKFLEGGAVVDVPMSTNAVLDMLQIAAKPFIMLLFNLSDFCEMTCNFVKSFFLCCF